MLSFLNLFEFWPSTSHLWHTDASHNPSLAPTHGHAWCCSFKVGAYFKLLSRRGVWLVMGSIIDNLIKLPRWSFETLYRLSLNWSRLYRESFLLQKYVICHWSHWLFLPRWLDSPEWIFVISYSFILLCSYSRVFFRSLVIFLAGFLSHCEFSEAVPVHVCGIVFIWPLYCYKWSSCSLVIWNGCDSAVLYELLISFPDPVCVVIHMTQTTAIHTVCVDVVCHLTDYCCV